MGPNSSRIQIHDKFLSAPSGMTVASLDARVVAAWKDRPVNSVKLSNMWLVATALTAAILATPSGCWAQSRSKYPDMNGQWVRIDPVGVFDPAKPAGAAQNPPLTPEYQAIYAAGLKDQAEGGPGTDPTYSCISVGMPRAMNAVFPMEVIVKDNLTYMLLDYQQIRRIHTDGRAFPEDVDGSFMGYSIGKWIDNDGDGAYDELRVETWLLKRAPGPSTLAEFRSMLMGRRS